MNYQNFVIVDARSCSVTCKMGKKKEKEKEENVSGTFLNLN